MEGNYGSGKIWRIHCIKKITKLATEWEKLAGETLANLWSFANVSPHQSFPPYGTVDLIVIDTKNFENITGIIGDGMGIIIRIMGKSYGNFWKE